MYIINNFVFGHDLSVDEEINNELGDLDIDFSKSINGKNFEVSSPYHGGQTASSGTRSVIFGVLITDDDGNKNFTKEIRNAKSEDYLKDYETFIKTFVEFLKDGIGNEEDEEYDEYVPKLIKFLEDHIPDFYIVESSS